MKKYFTLVALTLLFAIGLNESATAGSVLECSLYINGYRSRSVNAWLERIAARKGYVISDAPSSKYTLTFHKDCDVSDCIAEGILKLTSKNWSAQPDLWQVIRKVRGLPIQAIAVHRAMQRISHDLPQCP